MATRAFFRFPDRYLLSSHSAPAAAIQMIGRGTVGALRGAAASSWSPPASNVVSLLHTRRRPSTGCGGPLTLHQVPAALTTTSAVPVAARETAAKATAAAGAPKTPSRQLTTCRAFGRNAAFPNVSLSSPLSYHHSQGPPRCLLSTGPQRVPPGAPPVTPSAVEVAPESAEWPAGELEGDHEVRFDLSRIPGTENARDGHMTLVFTCCKCNKRSAKKFSKVRQNHPLRQSLTTTNAAACSGGRQCSHEFGNKYTSNKCRNGYSNNDYSRTDCGSNFVRDTFCLVAAGGLHARGGHSAVSRLQQP